MVAGFLAGFGVIWLNNWFDQDDIRFGNRLFHMFGFLEITL